MKNFFLSLCFVSSCFWVVSLEAKLTSIASPEEATQKSTTPMPSRDDEQEKITPDKMNPEELDEYVQDRLSGALLSTLEDDAGQNGASSTSIQPSDEALAAQAEAKKSTFEKIYDNAMKRISGSDEKEVEENKARLQQEFIQHQAQQQEWQKPNFDVISITLPGDDKKTMIPAKEHIPYLYTDIQLLSNGLTYFDEKIVVIANNDKVKTGLVKSIPLYVSDRNGKRHKVSVSLIGVTANGTAMNYRISEYNDRILIEPDGDYTLEPGVYEYEFRYAIDRQLAYYKDFDELYWNLTGSDWNLVITRAGASITLHEGMKNLGQVALTGYPQAFTDNYIVTKDSDSVTSFVNTKPLFIGEGMHIISSISKSPMTKPDFTKKMLWFIDDYGDILFSVLGLLAIFISYASSWDYIKHRNFKQSFILKKTAPMMRYLTKGKFDNISFGAFLLEMFRKNIIDIQRSEQNILLIKKTDNLKSLSKEEKKAIDNLFPNKDAIFNVNQYNMLKLRRAYGFIEKEIINRFRYYALRLNLNYLFFSIGMLLFAELFIAYLHLNTFTTFVTIVAITASLAFYMLLFMKHFKNKILNFIYKTVCVLLALVSFIFLSLYINPIASLMIALSIATIIVFTNLFARRSGLVRNNINEAADFKNYIERNVENISLGREFLSQQANIEAFELSSRFESNPNIKDFYKLDIVNDIVQLIKPKR